MKRGDQYFHCWACTDDETGKVETSLDVYQITSILKKRWGEGKKVFLCQRNDWNVVKGKLQPLKAFDWHKRTIWTDSSDPKEMARCLSSSGFRKSKVAAIRHAIRSEIKLQKRWGDSEDLPAYERELKALRRRLTLELKKVKK